MDTFESLMESIPGHFPIKPGMGIPGGKVNAMKFATALRCWVSMNLRTEYG